MYSWCLVAPFHKGTSEKLKSLLEGSKSQVVKRDSAGVQPANTLDGIEGLRFPVACQAGVKKEIDHLVTNASVRILVGRRTKKDQSPDLDPDLLANLPPEGVLDTFAEIHKPPGHSQLALGRILGPPNEQHIPVGPLDQRRGRTGRIQIKHKATRLAAKRKEGSGRIMRLTASGAKPELKQGIHDWVANP